VDTVHECDRQTDGRTEGQTDRITITKTVPRIASHGKNYVIIHPFGALTMETRKLSKGDKPAR